MICTIEGCFSEALCKTWCGKHYQRWQKHGDPEYKRPTRKDWLLGILQEVPDEECREAPWADKTLKLRPKVTVDGSSFGAAQYILSLVTPRPGLEFWALHSCDNPFCCAPWHLRWGTMVDNGADMKERNRSVGTKYRNLLGWLDEQGIKVPDEFHLVDIK